MNMILNVSIIILTLLVVAALTAASEISMIAVSRLRLRRLATDGSKAAKMVLKVLEAPEKFFGTILVINNIVDSLIASIMTVVLVHAFSSEKTGVIVATIFATLLIILFEVVAKTLAARQPERLSLLLVLPVSITIRIFTPLIHGLTKTTNFVVNLLGGKTDSRSSLVSDEEIRALVKIGAEEDKIHKEKYKMLSRIFDFSETLVRTVMTPRSKMVSIDINAKLEDILDKALETGFSRIPVYREKTDNVVGLINMKDLLNISVNKELFVLQDIVYPPVFIQGGKKVTELLRDFQKGHTHLAVVLDPHGKVEGLVTLEDILEEIVGEIEDEYDIRTSFMGKSQ
jgi:putative hemolysin